MSLTVSNEGANAEADALCAKLNTGYLRLYSGVRPATPDTALSGNTLLAELRFAASAFGAAVGGVAAAAAIASVAAAATGTATFFRALKSDGTSPVVDGSVGLTGSDLNMNSNVLQVGAAVVVTSLTITAPKQ